MARKLVLVGLAIVAFGAIAGISFATTQPKTCPFSGSYSFFFWDPANDVDGVGYLSVNCAGKVLPGGIIDCFAPHAESESFIESGGVFLESDGEGTMLIEGEGAICATSDALELDISVVHGGKTVLFNSNAEEDADSGLIPQSGHSNPITGRADKCFSGTLSGCYDVRFWSGPLTPGVAAVGDCTICLNGTGGVTGGSCSCGIGGSEFLSGIVTGGYTLGEGCESSTGYLWFTTSSSEICGKESSLALDFAAALGGEEIIGACDTSTYILDNTSLLNAGADFGCAFEGYKH